MKLKNILFIAIAILTIGLFVACNDDVVVAAKDNNVAYTQVLESNGAFEYAGTKYETLQDALNAIENGKLPASDKTIKVLRNVTGPVAAIGKNQSIVLDLNGNTLTFIDVTDGALSVGNGTTLTVKDGSMGLFDTSNADISVVKADDAYPLTFEGVNINAEGAKTLEATNTTINVKDGSAFTGETSVTGGIFNSEEGTTVAGTFVANGATMNVKNNMTAGISLNNGSSLQVSDSGHAVISSITGEYTIAAANESAITNNTGAAIETVTAVCYIDRVGDDSVSRRTYYGNLLGAFENLEQDNLTIVFFANDLTIYTETLVPAYPVIIDLAGFDVTANITSSYSLNLVSNADGSVITGIITAAEVGLRHVAIEGNVVSNGDMLTQNAVIEGTVNVNNDGTLTDGTAVTANNTTTYANGSEFKGNIKTSGLATFNNSKFTPVLDVAPTITSTLAYDAEKAPNGVVINNATGTAGAITAASGVVINNSGITSSGNNLTTGVITAKHASEASYYDVAITGPTTSSTLTIGNSTAGSILYAKAVTSKRAVFAGIVGGALTSTSAQPVASLTDGTYTPAQGENPASYEDGSTFHGAVTATGSINLTDSVLNPSSESANDHFVYSEGSITIRGVEFAFVNDTTGKAGVWADKGASISITDSKGVAHKIVTKNASGSVPGAIVINNSGLTGTFGVQGDITSNDGSSNYNDVTLTGKSSTSSNNTNTYVYGNITGNDISLDYTTVNGNVKAYDVSGDDGSVVATNSTVGDNASSDSDYVHARDIRISNSTVKVAKLIKGVEVVNEVSTDVSADLIHLENVIGTVFEAKVAAASAVDYSANNAGTATDPVYYAFYLKNAFTSGGYGAEYDFNINKVTSAGRTGTSSTASEPDQTVQAVYINNANTVDRYINSAGVGDTLSSIAATNGDVYVEIPYTGPDTENSVISITGSIATTGSGNVVLKGRNTDKRISVIGAVSSVGSVTTQFCDITGAVSGTTITDNTSTFHNAINASGLVTFNNSYFNPATAGATAIKSTLPYDAEKAPNGVVINNATGTAGAITAASGVVIDNASASATLATGTITAKSTGDTPSYYNVTVKGNSTNEVTVASIPNAADVSTSYAVVSGAVGTTETPVASLTDGTVANNTYSNGSEFQGDVTATGAVVLYSSTTKADVISDTSVKAYAATLGNGTEDDIYAPNVSITNGSTLSLGIIKDESAYADSVTINSPANSSAVLEIHTGSLTVSADNAYLTVASATATGATSISGGTFTGIVTLSGSKNISGGVFSGLNNLSGPSTITSGNFSGTTTFTDGIATISGGSFGSSSTNKTTIGTDAVVYVNACTNMHLASSNSGIATFKTGTVTVYERSGLIFVGSRINQDDYTQNLTIALGTNINLGDDASLSSTIKNLTLSMGNYDITTNGNYVLLASSSGTYTVTGTGNIVGSSSSPHGGVKYHEGVTITCPAGLFINQAEAVKF